MTFTPKFTPTWRMSCAKAVSEKKIRPQKCQKRILRGKFSFRVKKYFFFRKIRQNRHFFRQNSRKFSIVEKLSFKLWSQFHTGATPERKLGTSMWELWRNDQFLAIFSKFDPSYHNPYDELVGNFLHACSPWLFCFTRKVSAKCMWLLAGLSVKNCKMRPKNRIIPS